MPRGGARIGAGRPKGLTKAAIAARAAAGVVAPAEILRTEAKAGRVARVKSTEPKVKAKKKAAAPKFTAGTPPKPARVKPETPPVADQVPVATESAPPELPAADQQVPPASTPKQSPIEFMYEAMNDPTVPRSERYRIAIALAPYMHPKTGEIGKKDLAQQAAENVSSGKFATAAPPKLAVVRN